MKCYLDGEWKSNWELTRQHIQDDCKLGSRLYKGLESLMGKMTVIFTDTHIEYAMPTMKLDDRKVQGWIVLEEMQVLAKIEPIIVIRTGPVRGQDGDESLTTLRFVDEDTYWVYLGLTDFADHHVREYFRRVKPLARL